MEERRGIKSANAKKHQVGKDMEETGPVTAQQLSSILDIPSPVEQRKEREKLSKEEESRQRNAF